MPPVGGAQPTVAAAADAKNDAIAVSSDEDDVQLARPANTSRQRGVLASMQVTVSKMFLCDAVMLRTLSQSCAKLVDLLAIR